MNIRIEVTEEQWLAGVTAADYLVLDLALERERPWLDEARDRAELIGRATGPADDSTLARALDLDVDFIALRSVDPGFDARRLPLRLIVEQGIGGAGEAPEHFGAAWARGILDWTTDDADSLAEMARRERIFLAAPRTLPDDEWLSRVAPFALAVPDGCELARLARIRGS